MVPVGLKAKKSPSRRSERGLKLMELKLVNHVGQENEVVLLGGLAFRGAAERQGTVSCMVPAEFHPAQPVLPQVILDRGGSIENLTRARKAGIVVANMPTRVKPERFM